MRSHSAPRSILVTIAMVGVAIAGAACGPAPSDPPVPTSDPAGVAAALEEGAQLTVWSTDPLLDAAAERFESDHPAVEIDILGPGDMNGPDAGLELTVELGENIPDVIELYSPDQAADYVRNGLLTDLASFGAEDLESSFVAAAWDSVSFANGIWALPVHADPAAVAYRADVLGEAGIDGFPVTWEEFAEAAATVKAETGFYLTAIGAEEVDLLLRQDAPRLVDWDGGDDVAVDVVNPSTLRTTAYWDDLLDDRVVLKSDFPDPFATLTRGDVASLIGTSAMVEGLAYAPQIFGAAGEVWRVASLPQWDADAPSVVGRVFEQWAVPTGSEHPLAAYGFLRWLASERAAAAADDDLVSSAPASIDVLSDVGWLDDEPAFFGGQQVNRVFADAAREMTFSGHDPAQFWAWRTIGSATSAPSLSGALREVETACIDFYVREGYTVTTAGDDGGAG
ncbi:extracellular solute-binding protein [Microbacter sp. GSS18]|nr:extracellular solute-binding protein [Microbacter sp. GSS18]